MILSVPYDMYDRAHLLKPCLMLPPILPNPSVSTFDILLENFPAIPVFSVGALVIPGFYVGALTFDCYQPRVLCISIYHCKHPTPSLRRLNKRIISLGLPTSGR